MTRRFASLAAVMVGSALLVGCESSNYNPKGADTNLAAYAAKANYPSMGSTGNNGILYNVNDDGAVTLNNGTSNQLTDFEVWVNNKYVIHVTSLGALKYMTITPETLFDKNGNKFSDSANKTVTSVEVKDASGFMKAMGPVQPQMNS